MIPAVRYIGRRDGTHFGECLMCYQGVASPDVFCTHCGCKWERSILEKRRPAWYDYPQGDRPPPSLWVIQTRYEPFHEFPDIKWHTVEVTDGGPLFARRIVEERRRRDPGDDFRAMPLSRAKRDPEWDGGGL